MKFSNLLKKTNNKEYEQRLKNEFGLFRKGKNWAYKGRGALDLKTQQQLYDKKRCMEAINYFRIVPGKPTIMVFNAKPPFALAASIQPIEAAKLFESIIKKTKLKIVDYKDSFMLSLP